MCARAESDAQSFQSPLASVRACGVIHDFGLLNALGRVGAAQAAIALAAAQLRQHLA